MKTLFRLVVLMLTLGGWALSAASLYVIRTPEKISILPRDRVEFLSLHKTFVDTRNWQMADAAAHPAVVRRLLERDKAALLQHLAPDAGEKELARLLADAIEAGESDQRPAPNAIQTAPSTASQARSRVKTHLVGEVRRMVRPAAEAAEPVGRLEPDSDADAGTSWLDLALSLDF